MAKTTGPPRDRAKISLRTHRGLTQSDRFLIVEYMRDFNLAETGARLGFTGDRAAIRRRVLEAVRRPEIRNEINKRIENRRARAEVSEQRLLDELRSIALANPLAACRVYGDDGEARFDIGLLTQADMAAIASLEIDAKGKVKLK